jgi:S1-C subfamily serine protease
LPYRGLDIGDDKDPQKDTSRVYVESVTKESPAAQAGLLPNDTIIRIDGAAAVNKEVAGQRIARKQVGEVVEFTITRGPSAEQMTLKMTVGDMDKDRAPPPSVMDFTQEIGLKVRDCAGPEPYQYKRQHWRFGNQFVIISEISSTSPLSGKVQAGDVLYGVNGTQMTSVTELKSFLEGHKHATGITITFWRDGKVWEEAVP